MFCFDRSLAEECLPIYDIWNPVSPIFTVYIINKAQQMVTSLICVSITLLPSYKSSRTDLRQRKRDKNTSGGLIRYLSKSRVKQAGGVRYACTVGYKHWHWLTSENRRPLHAQPDQARAAAENRAAWPAEAHRARQPKYKL